MKTSLHACRLRDRTTPNNRDFACRYIYIHVCLLYSIIWGITHFFITSTLGRVILYYYAETNAYTTQSLDQILRILAKSCIFQYDINGTCIIYHNSDIRFGMYVYKHLY